ncbi:MAG TPA: DEAD/DEAH box helicase [Terriglobia bacterium]
MPELKPFQVAGARFLAARTRALLACEPGTGKTAQVIQACSLVGARRVLVVCPAVGIEHWKREFKRWWPGAVLPHVDVISYDRARGLRGVKLRRYDVLVPDECHFAKNPAAQRTHALYAKGGLGYYADRIWALSGTPAPNHAGELWPLLRAFGATGMGYEEFIRYFCRVDDMGKIHGTRMDRVDKLKGIMEPFLLRRRKRDVLPELGEIDVQEWYVEPRADYCSPVGDSVELAGQECQLRAALAGKSAEELLAFLAGDKEFATLRRYNALLKAPAVFDQVMFEIDNGLLDKVVIYGYHKEPLEILRQKFDAAGVGAALVYGGTTDRDGEVQRWKSPGGPKVMLASIIAAGVVLDFTEAHQGVMVELDWVVGNNQQAAQRMHRHGQESPVTVRVAIGSEIDEIVNDVLIRKTRELAAIFD